MSSRRMNRNRSRPSWVYRTGNDRWYDEFVPLADRLYDEHVETLKREGLLDG